MSDGDQRPVSERLRWDDSLTRARSGRALLNSPVRLGLAIGAAIMFVGALLPWAEGMVGLLPVRFGGFDGAADGLILAAFAIVALLMVRSPDFLEAVDGPRRWAPLLLGLACVGVWLLGWQSAQFRIEGWEDDDGSGSMTIGYWIAGVGVALLAVVGAYATLRHHEGQTSDPLALVRMPRRSDAVTLVGWVGGIGGLVVGALAALAIFPPQSVSAPMLFMAAIGLIAGAYLGRSLGRVVAGR
ncbi:MAG TPA: hypothetical protein VFO05_06160 [Candidatus Limnocylindrales bacterium]|nr:hypothetical protein [Candidatus Limnocylindrales bacterium]